jgi:hypothetical protein
MRLLSCLFTPTWTNRPTGWLKTNFEASFVNGEVVYACITRDDQRDIVKGRTGTAASFNVFGAEAFAALQAIKMSDDQKATRVIIVGDSLGVVKNGYSGNM